MKSIKYIFAILLLLLALSQVIPIFSIASGLIEGEPQESSSYFIGKLIGHIFITVLILLVANKLIKSARSSDAT